MISHLRFVHFSMITLCGALIFASLDLGLESNTALVQFKTIDKLRASASNDAFPNSYLRTRDISHYRAFIEKTLADGEYIRNAVGRIENIIGGEIPGLSEYLSLELNYLLLLEGKRMFGFLPNDHFISSWLKEYSSLSGSKYNFDETKRRLLAELDSQSKKSGAENNIFDFILVWEHASSLSYIPQSITTKHELWEIFNYSDRLKYFHTESPPIIWEPNSNIPWDNLYSDDSLGKTHLPYFCDDRIDSWDLRQNEYKLEDTITGNYTSNYICISVFKFSASGDDFYVFNGNSELVNKSTEPKKLNVSRIEISIPTTVAYQVNQRSPLHNLLSEPPFEPHGVSPASFEQAFPLLYDHLVDLRILDTDLTQNEEIGLRELGQTLHDRYLRKLEANDRAGRLSQPHSEVIWEILFKNPIIEERYREALFDILNSDVDIRSDVRRLLVSIYEQNNNLSDKQVSGALELLSQNASDHINIGGLNVGVYWIKYFGAFVVMMIQLYFFHHLNVYYKFAVTQRQPITLKTPWIVLYPLSKFARTIIASSLTILPLVTNFMTIVEHRPFESLVAYDIRPESVVGAWFLIMCIFLSLVYTIETIILLWKLSKVQYRLEFVD